MSELTNALSNHLEWSYFVKKLWKKIYKRNQSFYVQSPIALGTSDMLLVRSVCILVIGPPAHGLHTRLLMHRSCFFLRQAGMPRSRSLCILRCSSSWRKVAWERSWCWTTFRSCSTAYETATWRSGGWCFILPTQVSGAKQELPSGKWSSSSFAPV